MPAAVPPDVLYIILSQLRGTSSIRQCALVCQIWLPIARYYLLAPDQALKLDQTKLLELLQLYDSSLSSLNYVLFHNLHLRQLPEPGDEENPHWRSRQNAVDKFLARRLPLQSTITSLFLEDIAWDSLSSSGLASLHTGFTSVKALGLQRLAISKWDQLLHLIAGLPALETLQLSGVPLDRSNPPTTANLAIHHPKLRELSFEDVIPPFTMSFFAHGIVYTSGISSISMVLPAYRDPHHPMIDRTPVELLKAAGAHLKYYKFRPLHQGWPPMLSGGSLADIIKLQYNTKLEVIVIDEAEDSIVESFMECLIRHPKPYLRLLRINMNSCRDLLDDEGTGTYALMEDALSNNFETQPPIQEPRVVLKPSLVIEIPNLSNEFTHGPRIDNNPQWTRVAEADYVRLMTSIWAENLPRTGVIWEISLIVKGLVGRVSE